MKKIVLGLSLLITAPLFSQTIETTEKDYSLARVGKKVQGVYLFIGTEPFYKYKYIATIKANIELFVPKSYDKTIAKAKKKYPYFNGMIFNGVGKADLVVFGNEEITRGGFALGQKVTFMKRVDFQKVYFDGVIVSLENGKDKAAIEYLDINKNKKIAKVFYGDVNPKK